MSRAVTTIEAATIVLLIITVVVSGIGVAYITGLPGVSSEVEGLSSSMAELAAAERDLATTVAELGRAVGAYAERIAAIEERISAVEEAMKPVPPVVEKKLEIYNGLSVGVEKAAFDTLVKRFEELHPDIIVVPVTMGWEDMHAALESRFVAGKPPDGFIDGGFAYHYAEADEIRWVDDLWEKTGYTEWLPKDFLDDKDFTCKGKKYTVFNGAMETSRTYIVYNKKIFDELGIETPFETWDEFWEACEVIKGAGITPISVATKSRWFPTQGFMGLLLNTMPEKYVDFSDGKLSATDPDVRAVFEMVARMAEYVNPDHPALIWAEAMDKVARGDCAMSLTFFSCWAARLEEVGAVGGVDYLIMPFPEWGGRGFLSTPETWVIAADAPHMDSALKFAEFWAREGGRIWCETRAGMFLWTKEGFVPGVTEEFATYYSDNVMAELAGTITEKYDPSELEKYPEWMESMNDVLAYLYTEKDLEGALSLYEEARTAIFG